ncbi:thiamine-repressible mitochondrial transport protein THI74 [Purpureocillium lavendulum]|uniref:Thiamine-repressible mitochondrial transport protein THI74 n=1 Tax=Purpureocillium lavendulum TaxID=1247861 RepID=A0AB34FI06_9HYPO|nr:thiamine-repressible mitochondrial transport protein THI74 [Purpureocillium lavendulum]
MQQIALQGGLVTTSPPPAIVDRPSRQRRPTPPIARRLDFGIEMRRSSTHHPLALITPTARPTREPTAHRATPSTPRMRLSEATAAEIDIMAAAPERRRLSVDAADLAASTGSSMLGRVMSTEKTSFRASIGLAGMARRTLGICLLLVTVFLWTLSNFLASFIFSDHTYDKPFFLVYINTSIFAVSLVPMFTKYMLNNGVRGLRHDVVQMWHSYRSKTTHTKLSADDDGDETTGERLLVDDEGSLEPAQQPDEKLGFQETAVLSLEFCMLWFLANYFASACLEYTSVASVTILTSTSSVWTLIFCALFRVESFTIRKLVGVVASLVGIVLISTVDLTGGSDENRGSFPHKTPGQIAIGDSMAFFSAVIYGMYVTVMKRRVGNEDKVDMRLFFGLVGVFNLVFLWPLFFILHWTGLEPLEMPPSGQVWVIIIVNSLSSFISDIAWAFAMLLTTPLVVTVGLSLTIPLSLVGEMIQYGQYSSFVYWIGAAVVFVSFVFVNRESHEDGEAQGSETRRASVTAV